MLSEELIKKIKESQYFPELQEYIISKIKELNSIEGLSELPNELAGEEAKVRAKTVLTLYKILSPFFDSREKREAREEEIKEAKKKFAIE